MIHATYTEKDRDLIESAAERLCDLRCRMVRQVHSLPSGKPEDAIVDRIGRTMAQMLRADLNLDAALNAPIQRWKAQAHEIVRENLRHHSPALRLPCPECGEDMAYEERHAGQAATAVDQAVKPWAGGYGCHGCGDGFESDSRSEDGTLSAHG